MIQPSVAARDKFVFLVLTQTSGQAESLIIDTTFTETTGNAFVALDGCSQHHMPSRTLSCFPNHCLGRELIVLSPTALDIVLHMLHRPLQIVLMCVLSYQCSKAGALGIFFMPLASGALQKCIAECSLLQVIDAAAIRKRLHWRFETMPSDPRCA